MWIRRVRWILAWGLFATSVAPASAQSIGVEAPVGPTVSGARALAGGARGGEVSVDGRLDDPAWRAARWVDLPFEVFPADNEPASVHTQCALTFDDEHLYFACSAQDPEPETIRAFLSRRDAIAEQDRIALTIDPFRDFRRGTRFEVSAIGVQADATFSALRRNPTGAYEPLDPAWDAIWTSAGRMTEGGYVVEAAIPLPFSSDPGRRYTTVGLLLLALPPAFVSPGGTLRAGRSLHGMRALSGGHVHRPVRGGFGSRRRSHPHPHRRSDACRWRRRLVDQSEVRRGAERALGLRGQPGRERGGQSGLLAGRGRQSPVRREQSLRPQLPGEATVLPRGQRRLRHSSARHLHPRGRRSRRGREAHGKSGAERRRPARRAGPLDGVDPAIEPGVVDTPTRRRVHDGAGEDQTRRRRHDDRRRRH